MKRWLMAAVFAGSAIGFAAAGCGGPPLSRDEQIQMFMAKDRRLQEELLASQRKVAELTAAGAKAAAAPAPAEDAFRQVGIRFGKFTGVVDITRTTGTERLKVVIEPIDATGDTVKRAGSLELEALEPGAAGQQPQLFHRWTFTPDELAQTWLSGMGTYAYVLRLPWPGGRTPAGAKLILRAKFVTLAGEAFSAEAEVSLARAPALPKAPEPAKSPPPAKKPAAAKNPAPAEAPAPAETPQTRP